MPPAPRASTIGSDRRLQVARTTLVKNATYTQQLISVTCTMCGALPTPQRTNLGAVDHARTNPGHAVTTQVLQSTVYRKDPR